MERAAGRGDAGRRRREAGGLPARPTAGAALARVYLEDQVARRAPELNGPCWVSDPPVLRRVRDALASGGHP